MFLVNKLSRTMPQVDRVIMAAVVETHAKQYVSKVTQYAQDLFK